MKTSLKIGLIRHAKIFYRDPPCTNGKTFDEAADAYDAAPVEEINLKIAASDFPLCFCSSKRRAIKTAEMIYNPTFIITGELDEVKNAAFFLKKIKVDTRFRKVMGRIAWFFNYHNMPETRRQSRERAAG